MHRSLGSVNYENGKCTARKSMCESSLFGGQCCMRGKLAPLKCNESQKRSCYCTVGRLKGAGYAIIVAAGAVAVVLTCCMCCCFCRCIRSGKWYLHARPLHRCWVPSSRNICQCLCASRAWKGKNKEKLVKERPCCFCCIYIYFIIQMCGPDELDNHKPICLTSCWCFIDSAGRDLFAFCSWIAKFCMGTWCALFLHLRYSRTLPGCHGTEFLPSKYYFLDFGKKFSKATCPPVCLFVSSLFVCVFAFSRKKWGSFVKLESS